jgi:4,5-DOPA dioxygenase extradiol
MPAIFFGHGSPLTAFQDNDFVKAWRQLGETLPRPREILSISGHWFIEGSAVTAMDRPKTIHDFYGFPEPLYRFHYAAPGSASLAARVADLAGPMEVEQSQRWGLDHGTWSVLMHAYPGADIPVVQLSLDARKSPREHYELGRRLAALRDEGVLVMGTGNIVHNLRLYTRDPSTPPNPMAESFRKAVQARLAAHDHEGLVNYLDIGPEAQLAQPTPDHFLPLIYIAALQLQDEAPRFITEVTEGGGVDMTTVVLGA